MPNRARATATQERGSDGRRLTLSKEQRTARAKKASAAAHTLQNYIKRIAARAPELTDDDVFELQRIIAPRTDHAAAYEVGLLTGTRLTAETCLAHVDGLRRTLAGVLA